MPRRCPNGSRRNKKTGNCESTRKTSSPKQNRTRRTSSKNNALSESQVNDLIDYYEKWGKLEFAEKEELRITFRKIKYVQPSKLLRTNQFYEHQKGRTKPDELYYQIKARIVDHFKYGDGSNELFDGK